VSSKTWVDVSQLVDWEGAFSGIQRVQYEISFLLSKDKNFHFFVWNYKTGFKEVDPMSFIYRNRSYTNQGKGRKKQLFSILSLFFGRILLRFSNALNHIFNTRSPFNPGDTVLLLGASWMDLRLLDELSVMQTHKKIRLHVLVHDLIPELFPHFFHDGFSDHFQRYLLKIFSLANSFLAISVSTKKDLSAFSAKHNLDNVDTHVITLGDDFARNHFSLSENPEPFILAVGTFEIRKNYELLYSVWVKAFEAKIELPKLVIVGKKGWLAEETFLRINSDLRVKDKIQILDEINDDVLSFLYSSCLFTVYVSWYEGWGLPIRESLKYGKPVIS
jgi:glycosyltransferase involved in cell wall biosynthesis